MNLIEKIEIKSFRSFGNQKNNKTQISDLRDLNIFSGGNDSGKSNVLRALNLFFNQNTNLNEFINFNKDFFKPEEKFKEHFIQEEMITIKIFFLNKKNKGLNAKNTKQARLPERFWVSRKWVKTSTYTSFKQGSGAFQAVKDEKKEDWETYFSKKDEKTQSNIRANISKQLTDFLNSIQYHYIPAIKDTEYFSHLYGELQRTLLKEEDSKVNSTKNNFEVALQKSTKELMDDFKKIVNNNNLNISAAFELPDLINLFKTLNVETGNSINLKYRGDGVQAKLIPEILHFIAIKELQYKAKKVVKGTKIKKYFIWGFEEPENSYEYKNLKLLAERFIKIFAKKVQIFITTHSREFLALEEKKTFKESEIINRKKLNNKKRNELLEKLPEEDKSSKLSLYRIWKNSSTFNASQVAKFDRNTNEWNQLNEDLGIDDLMIFKESKIIENFQETIQKQKDEIDNSKLTVEQKSRAIEELEGEMQLKINEIGNLKEKIKEYEKICVCFEDEYTQIYKIAYLKLNSIECSEIDFEKKFSENSPFLFFGKNGSEELYKFLNSATVREHELKKVVGVFDFDDAYNKFNGLHPKRWSSIEGNETIGFYRKRLEIEQFYTILLPVPIYRANYANSTCASESKLETELLFTDDVLKKLNAWDEKVIPRTSIKESIFIGKKKEFWKKLFQLDKKDFEGFIQLFKMLETDLWNTQ